MASPTNLLIINQKQIMTSKTLLVGIAAGALAAATAVIMMKLLNIDSANGGAIGGAVGGVVCVLVSSRKNKEKD